MERVQIKPGETIPLPRMFIQLGRDWAEAFAPYKAHVARAFPRTFERPQWWAQGNFTETRKAHCIAPMNPPEATPGIWIFDNTSEPRPFAQIKGEIDEAVADGKEKGYTPLFYQFAWWANMKGINGFFMFDSVCGDYTERTTTTKRVVDYVPQRRRANVLLHQRHFRRRRNRAFRDAPHLLARDASGFPQYNSNYPMLMLCPGAPGIRKYWEDVLVYILKTLDADGVFSRSGRRRIQAELLLRPGASPRSSRHVRKRFRRADEVHRGDGAADQAGLFHRRRAGARFAQPAVG
jgi:hypothetical protein